MYAQDEYDSMLVELQQLNEEAAQNEKTSLKIKI